MGAPLNTSSTPDQHRILELSFMKPARLESGNQFPPVSVDEYVGAAAPVILIIFRTGKAAMIILIGWAGESTV